MNFDQTNFLDSLGWAALNSLWQMALLLIIFKMINSSINLTPSFKSHLASFFLFAGFAWFVFTFIITLTNSYNITINETVFLTIQESPQLNYWLAKSLPMVSIIYLSMLIIPILKFVRNYRYVQIIRRYGLSKISIDSRIYINKTTIHLGIKRKVQIWVSELVSSPVTIGFLKPIILIPIAAINNLSPYQLEAVLLHELAHIKRSDYLINLFIHIIRTILYFNPFVNSFIKIIETEREKSCDEMVLQFQYNSHHYASALLELEKANHSQQILALAASGNNSDLLYRIENILNIKKKNSINLKKTFGLIFSLLFIASLSFFFLLSQQTSKSISVNNSTFSVMPKYFFVENPIAENNSTEVSNSSIINRAKEEPLKLLKSSQQKSLDESFANTVAPPEFINISLNLDQTHELTQNQEDQIKSALAASKKVLENSQWKNVEENIADVFTQKEKEYLKESYQKEIEKFDWKLWENRLRTAYDNINWDKVNVQLNNAISQIRIDSLKNVYNNVAVNLNEVQKELATQKLVGIPDTNISLESIIEKKELVLRILSELKAVKNKKIVHL